MKNAFGFIASGLSYLSLAIPAFAQKIDIKPPPGSIPETTKLQQVPQFIITLLFVIGIIIAIVFLLFGGIRWIISGGDKTAVENARNTIVAAIIGLVIITAAFFILNVVFTFITGKPFELGNLCIPSLTSPNCP